MAGYKSLLNKQYFLEKDLQMAIINACKKKYGKNVWVYKTHDMCRIGIPDLLICMQGQFIAIELKRTKQEPWKKYPPAWKMKTCIPLHPPSLHSKSKGGRPRGAATRPEPVAPIQLHNLRMINQAGGTGFAAHDFQVVMDKLDKIWQSVRLFGV